MSGRKRSWRDRIKYAEEGAFGRFLRTGRHPLRVLAMGMSAAALAYGTLLAAGMVAGVIGAMAGVVFGEILGRSRYRLPVVLGAGFVVMLLAWLGSDLATDTEALPAMIGPGSTLAIASVIRYGVLAFVLTTSFRSAAVRAPSAMALELVFVILSLTVVFAAHRDGVIARPLWLSDWAWQKGIDPADIFLGLGAGAAVILAVLLVLETRGGRTASSLLALPLLAILAVACLDVVGRPNPQVDSGLGLTETQEGDPPPDLPDDPDDPNGNQPGGDAGMGPSPQNQGDAGAGGQQDDQGDAGAGGGNGADAGSSEQNGGLDAGGSSGGQDAGTGQSGGELDGGGGGGTQDAGGGGGGGDAGPRDAGGGGGGGSDAGPRDAGGGGGGQDGGAQQQQQQQGEQGEQQQQQQQQTGPTALEEQLEQSDGPQNSPAPMAVVIFENDYEPPGGGYYFRQEIWSQFNGTRLVPSTIAEADRDVAVAFPAQRLEVEHPPERDRTRVRARVALLVEHPRPFALEAPVSFAPIANPNADRFVRAYRFESLSQEADFQSFLGRDAGNDAWSEEVLGLYTQGHPDPRFAELAEQILEEELPADMREDPFARALAIKLWLDRELIYSTSERHAGVAEPTADFLFGNRIGYCTHFAHSAVYLWRAAGVPARIGTGYMVPAENRRGGSSLLVRSGDAHAWPELYLEGAGWVVLDIAAERNLDEAGEPLDEDLQRMLGEMAREEPPDPEDELQEEPEDEQASSWDVPWWKVALVVFAVVLICLYFIKLWRGLRPIFARGPTLPRVAYRAVLDRLSEVGLSREFGESREAFADRVSTIAPSFRELTALHVSARLGNPVSHTTQRPEWAPSTWRKLTRAVSRERRKGTRFFRRILGLLHPVSFLDSR